MSASFIQRESGLVVPQHVAFIMDGNRTWAKDRQKESVEGHRQGVDTMPPLVEHAIARGISMVTFWALSPQNLERAPEEVMNLMTVFNEALDREDIIGRLLGKGSKVNFIGELHVLPGNIQMKIDGIRERSKHNNTITVNIALNYGGEEEISRAATLAIKDGHTAITPAILRSYLYVGNDVDLVIRSGGQMRSSGFMPVQTSYAEWYYSDKLWPDFTTEDFDIALANFSQRKRKFGK